MFTRSTRARVLSGAALAAAGWSVVAVSGVRADAISGGYASINNDSSGSSNQHGTTPPGNTAPFSGGASGAYSNVQVSVSYGAASASGGVSVPVYSYFDEVYAAAGGSEQWTNTVTINNPALTGQQGVLHTAYHFAGSFSVDQFPLPWGYNEGTIYIDGNPYAQVGYDWYNQGAYDRNPGDFATIPYDRTFTFGQPFDMGAGVSLSILEANYDGAYNGASFSGSMSIRGGGISVTDAGGNAVGFSSTSPGGSAAGTTVPQGSSYAGFTVHNDVVTGHGTVMNILGGTASADGSIAGTFVAGDPTGGTLLHSDVVDFHGTNHDLFVLELTYDPAGVADESALVLGWRDPATGLWTNAVNGDSDGGARQLRILGPYVAPDDFVLGDYGVDTVNHVVWAVVDHNSEFAAVTAVPEPGCAALVLAGAGIMARRRRK